MNAEEFLQQKIDDNKINNPYEFYPTLFGDIIQIMEEYNRQVVAGLLPSEDVVKKQAYLIDKISIMSTYVGAIKMYKWLINHIKEQIK